MRVRAGLAVTAIILGVALVAAGASHAAGGTRPAAVLDPSFGDHGVLSLSSESTFTAYGTATRGGDLLVSGGSGVQVLDSRGATGEAFGGGSLTLPPARGDTFELGGFTVDSHGRLLVVGTSVFPESENPSPLLENGNPAFRPGALRMFRFLPDGHLDPSFGQGGVLETDLGLPPPLDTEGQPLGTRPALQVTGVAVAPHGRIVVTGGAVSGFGGSCEHDIFGAVAVSAGFVARFSESGAPDPSFGDDGLVGGLGLSENALGAETIGDPLVSPSGTITYRSVSASICERNLSHLGVAQLTPDGRSRMAFGRDGAIVGRFKALASGPRGSVFALAEEPRHGRDPVKARVLRFAPDGGLDRSFGRDGQATVELGPSYGTTLDSLAVDGRGRVLVGGTLETQAGRAMVLLRVSAGGQWERNFGPHGRVASKLPQLTQFGASDIFFDPQGRLVAVHQSMEERTGGDDLLVARYLLRN